MPIMPRRTYPGPNSRLVSLTFAPAPRAKAAGQPPQTIPLTPEVWEFVRAHPSYRLKFANYHDGSQETFWGQRNHEAYTWLQEHVPNA